MEDLRNARESIHMEYFIWRSDALTAEVKEILIAKRREGVEVRVLYDAIGSLFIDRRYVRQMRAAGIEMQSTRLLEENGRRHFMTRRFDRTEKGNRVHALTLGGIGGFSWLADWLTPASSSLRCSSAT